MSNSACLALFSVTRSPSSSLPTSSNAVFAVASSAAKLPGAVTVYLAPSFEMVVVLPLRVSTMVSSAAASILASGRSFSAEPSPFSG
jgi:hypothetical protein